LIVKLKKDTRRRILTEIFTELVDDDAELLSNIFSGKSITDFFHGLVIFEEIYDVSDFIQKERPGSDFNGTEDLILVEFDNTGLLFQYMYYPQNDNDEDEIEDATVSVKYNYDFTEVEYSI
jgi:hypothetical protein